MEEKDSNEERRDDVTGSKTDVKSRHHMDSAWSWVVDAGIMCTLILYMGVQRSYGLFFVEIQDKYDVSASVMSLIGGTVSATYSLGAIVVLTFALNVMSERQCIMIGIFMMTSAFSLSCLVTSFPVFVVTLGAVTGTSMSFIYGPSFVLLGKYFDRHLTLAQAIANTGVSAGGLLMPFVVRAILDEFSFPAGLLVIGGILCHMFILASLCRPVLQRASRTIVVQENSETNENAENHRKQGQSVFDPKHEGQEDGDKVGQNELEKCLPLSKYTVKAIGDCNPSLSCCNNEENETTEIRRNGNTGMTMENGCESETIKHSQTTIKTLLPERFPLQIRNRTYSESGKDQAAFDVQKVNLHHSLQQFTTSQELARTSNRDSRIQTVLDKLSSSSLAALTTTPETLYASMTALHKHIPGVSADTVNALQDTSFSAEESHSSGFSSHAGRGDSSGCGAGLRSKFCSAEACRNIPMWGVVLYQAFGLLTGVIAPAYLPPVAKEKGLSDNEATFLLTLIGGLDIVSRLTPGVIAHYKILKPHQMVILSLALQGLLCQFLAFFNSFEAMVGFCVGFGCLSGVFFSMTHATIIEFVGLEGFRLTFGFVQLFNGISAAAGYPIVGALKDMTGSYVTSFHLLGATEFVAAGILVTLPFLCRLQKRLEAKRDKRRIEMAELEDNVPLKNSK